MDPLPPDVTDAELAVLQALWEQGTATIRVLTDALYPGGTAAQYGTVQKLLERLEGKGFVARDRARWPHEFSASVGREAIIGRRLRAMADKLCGGSLTPLLLHLLRAESLSDAERLELRTFLEQLKQAPRPKDRGR